MDSSETLPHVDPTSSVGTNGETSSQFCVGAEAAVEEIPV